MSNTVIARPFNLLHDFRSVRWGATIWYNVLRAFGAGLILTICMFVFPIGTNVPISQAATPLVWPLAYLFIFLPLGLVVSIVAEFFPFAYLFGAFISLLAVTAGDPIVCILKRFFPNLVTVERPPLLSFKMVIFVIEAEAELTIAK